MVPQSAIELAKRFEGFEKRVKRGTEIAAIQQQLASDPGLMGQVSALQNDPEIQAVLSDPELTRLILSGDLERLRGDARIQRLMAHPTIQAIMGQMMAR